MSKVVSHLKLQIHSTHLKHELLLRCQVRVRAHVVLIQIHARMVLIQIHARMILNGRMINILKGRMMIILPIILIQPRLHLTTPTKRVNPKATLGPLTHITPLVNLHLFSTYFAILNAVWAPRGAQIETQRVLMRVVGNILRQKRAVEV